MRKSASREIISASVELCDTPVCFLHIQLIGTNVWLPKMLILSLLHLRQNQNPEEILICIVVLCVSHMTTLFEFTCVMNVRYQTSQAIVARCRPFRDGTSKLVYGP